MAAHIGGGGAILGNEGLRVGPRYYWRRRRPDPPRRARGRGRRKLRAANCAPQPPTTSRARRRRALIKDPFLAPQGESAGFAFTKDEMLEIFKAKTDAFKAADYEESGFTHEKNATTPEYARRSPSRHPPRTALTAHRSRLRSAGSSRR